MTRSKKAPSVHKPPFDEESALRFAETGLVATAAAGLEELGSHSTNKAAKESTKGEESARQLLDLMLKPETIVQLRQESLRKGKPVEQIIDKLVAKHLGKR